MSVLQPPSNATNVLQLSKNMLATNGVNICQMWATTPIPTTPKVAASVMLVAPQYFGHFPWFLVKSPLVNFARSLQPTQTERAFPLTWDDQGNAVRFSVGNRTFMLSFANSGIFWCFKYMVYCRDQVDSNCVRPFSAEMLLDAFIKFKIPAQIPLGTGRETGEGVVQEDSPEEYKYANQAVAASSEEALHVHPSAASPEAQGSPPTATHINRHHSPTRPPTPVPVQEGLSPANANIQPVADAMQALYTIGDGCHDRQNAVSHKKRKHDMG
ncbi:hypothetical protein PISMIDRAFT_20659 [Pisolithus microcarpus 441]|uniref:Uncharacterized protein n=1 Tax=Pisolithus microcarpus 441 TaxID=765257 RepID=A0A0D0AGW7_9AGAM|nr:hypothetical protein PISMIDRAFT_20659 [Pisolithus microcarpus 441]